MNLLEDKKNQLWKTKNIIYCYTNLINNKKYIGQTITQLKTRHYNHVRASENKSTTYDNNVPFHNAIRKYGIENFKLEIIHIGQNLEELNYFESYYIKYYNTLNINNNGYNISSGGSKGNIWEGKSEEEFEYFKKNISEKLKGKFEKEKNPFYGKHHTEETKKLMSEKHKGKKLSDEHRKRMSESQKGKGTKKIAQYDKDMNLIKIWNSGTEIVEELNLKSHGNIISCCKNKLKSAYGFVWRYYEEVE